MGFLVPANFGFSEPFDRQLFNYVTIISINDIIRIKGNGILLYVINACRRTPHFRQTAKYSYIIHR